MADFDRASFDWHAVATCATLAIKASTMVFAILVSWSIAFIEYCFAVPTNRIGNAVYSPPELKSL
jgi:uncharacterized protein (DUF486 family)